MNEENQARVGLLCQRKAGLFRETRLISQNMHHYLTHNYKLINVSCRFNKHTFPKTSLFSFRCMEGSISPAHLQFGATKEGQNNFSEKHA
jgi:hypothetical protein